MKIPRWAQVLIGAGIVMVFLGIGAIIAVTAYFSQNVAITESSSREADDEFEKVRQRFKGKPVLVEINQGERVVSARRVELDEARASIALPATAAGAPRTLLARIQRFLRLP